MSKYYTDEKNVQILVALLKAHGIRRAILSPGSANSPLVASLQYDDYFECFSCVDERSAAYMACGLAEESSEPVVISCTGATASRNYLPGLTEAFYRKLPVLAITSTMPVYRVGHHVAQVIDRSNQPNDTYSLSVTLPIVKDAKDQTECELKINDAILELRRWNGGPSHINLQTSSLRSYATRELPEVRKISHYTITDELPKLPPGRKAIFVGSHSRFTANETRSIEDFCEIHNGVVFCDHTSQYYGKYRVMAPIIGAQQLNDLANYTPDLTIHIGEVSGDYYGTRLTANEVWRISKDGHLRDTFGRLKAVFAMPEENFFKSYSEGTGINTEYYDICNESANLLSANLPDLPFSNIWIASVLSKELPDSCTLHFGILNSLRSWNFFGTPASVRTASNVGGFGIDGVISSLVGASLGAPDKLCFCVIGDLAFFYDINTLGNRHIRSNVRILLINNGQGTEFKTYKHHTSHFGNAADEFISAAGHFGCKSPTLVKNYAENLGFNYITASDKNGFEAIYKTFIDPKPADKPLIFEVFTEGDDESKALEIMMNLDADPTLRTKEQFKDIARGILGKKGADFLKKIKH